LEGSLRFGLYHVYIRWNERDIVERVRFLKKEFPGNVPPSFRSYFAGKVTLLSPLLSVHVGQDGVFGQIYKIVSDIPYGETRTYKEIADLAGTGARVVGMAMKRNLTPIIIPCHRVVSSDGIGGFTPDVQIKKDLLDLEKKVLKRLENLN